MDGLSTKLARQISSAVVVALMAVPFAAFAEEPVPWPTDAWEATTPEAAGFDPAKLADALTLIRHAKLDIHSLTLVRHGKLVLDANFYPYDRGVPHNLASVTKSVMTTLIAIAADQGKLKLDQPVLSFFPGRTIANRDATKEKITVRHLTGMSSGLDCVGEHDEPTLHEMNASADWIQFTLDLKMAAEPGTVFSYCSPGMHLLSAILQQATGMKTLDFARKNLFEPLGIKEAIWPADPQGVNHGWGDLFLYPQDAAKIGYLWLHGGQWDGRQIVSKDWVEQSSRLQIKTGPNWGDDYGYGWWITTGEEIPQYAAAGRGGQRIGVFPTLDVIVVTTGGGFEPGTATDLIGAAFVSPDKPLPANAEGEAKLTAAIAALALPPEPTPVAPLPAMAARISGKTYRLSPNPLQLETLRLAFDGSAEAKLFRSFSQGQPPREGAVGLDGVYRMSPGEGDIPAGMRGRWIDEKTFAVEYDAIAYIDGIDLKATFDGDRITIHAKDRTYEAGVTIEGMLEAGGG
jgi:CubicO group peptidase (beta-lactamase class C family)